MSAVDALRDFGRGIYFVAEGVANIQKQATAFQREMAKLEAAINVDLYGPPWVVRTVAEEEVDFSAKTA